ncbi:HSP31 [Symbiodinium sp. CCMP2456]|nr:HSP31 [Symbiodinium sp. CCMP2456]
MALVLWGWSLSRMPPPRKPTEACGDQDLPPAFPIDEDLHVQPRLSDGCQPLLLDGGEMCRRARMDTGEFGVPSLETRQSYFSNSMPTRPEPPAPPNRILHNHHKVLVENMMKELSTFSGRRKLQKEVDSRRRPDPDEDQKMPASPQPHRWNFTRPWFKTGPST